MSDYQTIEPNAFEVGVSPLFDGVTIVLEHDGQKTVIVLPASPALCYAEMVHQAAEKALKRGTAVKAAKPIDSKEIVPRARGERLDS